MLIPCPVCGSRDHSEFTYFGDATVERPRIDDGDQARWAAYIYDRTNPRGVHREFWHHVHGCRLWLEVTRDTLDHDISAARLVGAWANIPSSDQVVTEESAVPVGDVPSGGL